MKVKKMLFKRILPIFMVALMTFTSIPADIISKVTGSDAANMSMVSAAEDYGLADSVEDGVILHAWNWSFNQIKEELPQIAAAGFTTVQTSPAQPNKDGSDVPNTGAWWKFYQPTDFKIGNKLGSKEDLTALCAEADKYGIKIIVDVVANHLANVTGSGGNDKSDRSQQIPDWIRNNDSYWHSDKYSGSSDGDRYQMTRGPIGMPDLNTGNEELQDYIVGYLNDLQDCGVDGFRFDAAKHIETPSDGGFASQFWAKVASGTKAKDPNVFLYGEIPNTAGPGGYSDIQKYTPYIRVTNNKYGHTVQSSVRDWKADYVKTLSGSGIFGENGNEWVLWNESHDTYAGEYGDKTNGYSDEQMTMAWCAVAARYPVALYFVRPTNMSASLGAHNNTYQDKRIAEMNKFHNYFAGQNEYASTSDNVLVVERGTTGVALVNYNQGSKSVSIKMNKLEDGTYKDQVSGNTFTVSGGTLTGTIGDGGVAAIYNAVPIPTTPTATISKEGGNFNDTLELTLGLKNATSGTYQIGNEAAQTYTSSKKITIGSDMSYGDSVTITLTATDGTTTSEPKKYTFTKVEQTGNIAYLSLPSGWSEPVYCYAYDSATEKIENAEWPGAKMTKDSATGYYMYEVPENIEKPRVIFYSSATNRTPADQEKGYLFETDGSWIYQDGTWKPYTSTPVEKGTVTVKYVDEDGKEISASKTLTGKVGDSYTATAATVSGYTVKTTPSNATGKYTKETITVTFVYTKDTDDTPKVTSDFADGSAFETENKEITLTLTNADEGTYCVDNGPVKKFTGSAKVKIGQGKIADTDVTVKATATKGTTTKEYTFIYKKKFKDTINEVTIPNAVKASEESLDTPLAASGTFASNYYKVNATGFGSEKTISSAADWTASELIAQGAANDDSNVFKGPHEYPVYDEYGLYAAYDDTNLYIGWQYVNVRDVVASDQQGAGTNEAKPYNAPIPQMVALDLGSSKGAYSNGEMVAGSSDPKPWSIDVGYSGDAKVNALCCFSSKYDGTPSLFLTNSDGKFSYDEEYCKGFKTNGIKYEYEDGLFAGITNLYGINKNAYTGLKTDMLFSNDSEWTDLASSHKKSLDTFYTLTIPYAALNISKDYIKNNGIGVMHISTYGASGVASIPADASMYDNAAEEYSKDPSSTGEKEDSDIVTTALARVGNGTITPPPVEELKLNFGADHSAPQLTSTALTLSAKATGGKSPYTYKYTVNGKEVTGNWTPSEEGEYALACTATDADGKTVVSSKYYTVEKDGENPPPVCKHTNTEVRDAKAATCTEDGYTGDTWCKDCNTKTATGTAIEKLGHQEAVKNQKEATCTEAGYTGDTYCKVCDTTLQTGTEIPAKGHTFDGDSGNAKPATCIEDGYTGDGYCTVCKETVKGETIPATGHKEAVKDKEEATCTNEGYTGDTYCTVCNVVIKEGTTVPKLEHKFDASKRKEGKAATCIEDGCEASEYCTLCNSYVGGAVIPATGHTFGDNAVGKKEPTCTEDGYTGDGTCTVCGTTGLKGTVIPATGHKFDASTVKDPTCTEPGYTGDGTCTVCGQEGVHGTEIPALGHDFSGRIINKREPSCEVAGYTGDTYCIRCREVLEEGTEIPATGHDFSGAVVNKKAATCTENGYTGDTPCVNCSKKHEGEVIPALGHKWNDGEVTKQPTATEKGIKTYTCTVCGETRKEEIAATGENNNNNNNGGNTNGNNNGTNGGNTNGNNNGTNGGNTNGNNNGTNGGNTNGTNNGVIEVPGVGDTVDDATTKATYRVTKDVGSVKEVEYVVADSKTETVEVPASITVNNASYKVTAISNGAFKNNKTLKSVVIGQNVKTIGDNAFKDCTNLTTVVMGANVTTIGNNAFYKCSKLTGVKLSAKTKSIGNYAFYKCTKLTSITIPSKVNKIGKYAFYGCKKLKKITIKTKSLTKKNVGTKAFKGISAKATIKVPSSKLTSYEKLLTDKGVGPKAKIKK